MPTKLLSVNLVSFSTGAAVFLGDSVFAAPGFQIEVCLCVHSSCIRRTPVYGRVDLLTSQGLTRSKDTSLGEQTECLNI